MTYFETIIPGVLIIEPRVFKDERGYFFESFRSIEFQERVGHSIQFVQENENRSVYGVLRGIHYQNPPFTQSKLARVVEGSVLDVAVDLRKDSPAFGKWVAVELNTENHYQLFLPRGIGHAMLCLSKTCIFQYKVDNYYAPKAEGYVAWNDPDLNIDWKIPSKDIIVSEKDSMHPFLRDINSPFTSTCF